jgi:dTDP-4-amino-4,6-dideoxygalactose transaminase
MLCTDNDAYAARCRLMSLHGISHDAWNRYRAEGSWYYEVVAPGFKYNMTDIAGALGLAQLRRADVMRARRQEIAEHYNATFKDHDFALPAFGDARDHAWHLYPLRLPRGVDRGAFVDALRAREIGASVHFIPLHLHPFYRDRYGFTPDSFPVSTAEYEREVSLPIYSAMSDADVDAVSGAVTAIRGASRVLAG